MRAAGAQPAPAATSRPAELPIRVTNAWIRALPGDLPAAGYATVANLGDAPLTLLGVSSPDYRSVMFHQSVATDGMQQMLPLDSLPLAAHASVSFAPGGYHLMLMQAQRPIAPGDRVVLTLHFAGGASLVVPFEVRRADGRPVERAAPAAAPRTAP